MLGELPRLRGLNDNLRAQLEVLEKHIDRLERMGPEKREQEINADTMEVLRPEIDRLATHLQAAESTARSLIGLLDRCRNAKIARR